MRSLSFALQNILTASHSARTRLRAVTGFPQSTTPTGTDWGIVDGDVRLESAAVVRGTLDATLNAPWGQLWPDGREVFVEYGVEIAGGQTEWVSLGYFGVDSVDQADLNDSIRITGSDRMAQVERTKAVFPWTAPVGTTHRDFITSLLYGQSPVTWFHTNAGVFPFSTSSKSIVADYNLDTTTLSTQISLDADTNFYEYLRDLADTVGRRIYFDYKGRFTLVDSTLATTNPALTLTAGRFGTVRNISRRVTREGAYNSVRAESSDATSGDPPWNYYVTPLSMPEPALSWYGQFGRILRQYASPVLTTSDACLAAAKTLYYQGVAGLPYTLAFDMVPHPGLEPLDLVSITFPSAGPSTTKPPIPGMLAPVTELHVADTITFPLLPGEMRVTTRGTKVTPT